MSKTYNTTFNIIVLAFIIVAFLPVLPIALGFYILLALIKIPSKYILYTMLAVLAIVTVIDTSFYDNFFITEQTKVVTFSLMELFKTKGLEVFNISKFNTYNWYFMIICGLTISSYLRIRREKKEKRTKAGVTSLNNEIEKVSEVPNKKTLKDGIYFGKSKNKKVFCDYNHLFCCGTTGAGKTVLLSNFIVSALEKNQGCLIVDGKGDIGKGSILDITKSLCKKYNRKLYVINMSDPAHSDKYNPFQNSNATTVKDMLINLTSWSEEHYKLNTERYLQCVIKILLKKYKKLSLDLIIKHIEPKTLKKLSNELANSGTITKEEHMQNVNIINISSAIAESAAARFATLQESDLGCIFNEKGVDIYNALSENAVILFVLNPLMYLETSSSLGRLALIDSKKAVSKLYNQSNKKTIFLFDELNVYASETLLNLINKSRSANITCCCAVQSLSDLDIVSDSFKNQVVENCNNFIFMRQNSPQSAELCAEIIGTVEKIKMTYQVGNVNDDENEDLKGSARKTREFVIHPDIIKNLPKAQAVFLSKDNNIIEQVLINKPF